MEATPKVIFYRDRLAFPAGLIRTATEWVREPWLGRVGRVEVRALADPARSTPELSRLGQAPSIMQAVPGLISSVTRTGTRTRPLALSTRAGSPWARPSSSASRGLIHRWCSSVPPDQSRLNSWEWTRWRVLGVTRRKGVLLPLEPVAVVRRRVEPGFGSVGGRSARSCRRGCPRGGARGVGYKLGQPHPGRAGTMVQPGAFELRRVPHL